ncbi:MAG TPA: M23 family metallopeptidase [Polyangia bacterium]|nr:M23 family metallopeptidase [Polyangia bacterium]
MILAVAGAVGSTAGCHWNRAPMHPETPAGSWYVVSRGETLADIAKRAGVPAEDILELNGFESAALVKPGTLLFVMTGAAPEEATAGAAAVTALGPAPALRWPLTTIRVLVGSPFGARWGKPHEGIDLPAPVGTPVFAAADGRVVYAGAAIRGYGNLIVLKHAGELLTAYAHNSVLLVSQGQSVRAGDRIALVGQSGHATGPHLHFEVRSGQIPRDPMNYLPPLGDTP